MRHCSRETTRRILNFPAIRPCESVPFSTLLSSLIGLCHSICEYSSKTFFVNRENVRNSVRLIRNLVIFLEEIPRDISCDRDSIGLSLSELHFVLQKVRYLLEDCARDDARLWMLMNSETVSDEFRVLVRAMALVLDVLPLDELGVGDEVKELVELVRNQAPTMKFEVEVDDQRILKEVFLILGYFEDGIHPGSSELRRVLEYLGIGSWSECNKVIKFLEGEIGLESQTERKKDDELLSSLMGFIIYSRSIVFEVVDKVKQKASNRVGSSEIIRSFADDFRCPITLEFMTDPVVIASGHTYDRSSILKWFRGGNTTCPKTGEKLLCADLVPNSALKQLVKQFCSENSIPFADSVGNTKAVAKTVFPGSLAAEQALKLLANFLVGMLTGDQSHKQSKAAFEIRSLTKTSIFNRSCLVEAGAIPPLLNLLLSDDPLMQENAIASLLNLSKFHGCKRIIVENGGLILILDVLKEGLKMEARQHAAGALFYLASVEEYRTLIGEIPDAIPNLMVLLRDGTERAKKNALVTIFGLLLSPDNHPRMLAAGLVPLLVDLVRSLVKEDLITDSLAVLSNLADKPDGISAILCSGALPMIVEFLGSSNSKPAREHCVSLLLALCIHRGADVAPVLVKNPSLIGTLYAQITDGTSRASKKANSLIKILHNFNEESSFGISNPAHAQERFIHAW